jgi:hypothetical protein
METRMPIVMNFIYPEAINRDLCAGTSCYFRMTDALNVMILRMTLKDPIALMMVMKIFALCWWLKAWH